MQHVLHMPKISFRYSNSWEATGAFCKAVSNMHACDTNSSILFLRRVFFYLAFIHESEAKVGFEAQVLPLPREISPD
jgi:hypothetical protein